MNVLGHKTYSLEDAVKVARLIIIEDCTFKDIEELLQIPHSSAQWIVENRVAKEEPVLYADYRKIMEQHKRSVRVKKVTVAKSTTNKK